MKIHFSNVNFSSSSGPNSFAGRLANQLTVMGHDIVDHSHRYDAFLAFIEPATRPHPKAKTVQRLDGIWFSPESYHHNKPIEKFYHKADAVIWQSEFDKTMSQKWFGERNGYVISNGIDLAPVSPYPFPKNFETFPSNHMYFCCAANWHGQKRLVDNVRLFKKIRAQLIARNIDSSLLVMGDIHDQEVVEQIRTEAGIGYPERIAYLGSIPHDQCLAIYRRCDYMIHLAWLDHCPNVVVESLSQGCPVICTDSGGTKEVVKDSGIIIPETTPYEYDLLDFDSPYALNLDDFVLPNEAPKVNNEHLNIETIAMRYLGAMR
jgi:glycosyltransferase involved in cell wall biosynthesis